jgi:hypothetical protein
MRGAVDAVVIYVAGCGEVGEQATLIEEQGVQAHDQPRIGRSGKETASSHGITSRRDDQNPG